MSNVSSVRLKTIPIMLDKKRTMIFDMNAFAELEEVYGDVDVAMEKMQAGSIKALRLLLWAGLIHEDENLTVKQVGAMLTPRLVDELSPEIEAAMHEAMPEKSRQEALVAKAEAEAEAEAEKGDLGNSQKPSTRKKGGTGQKSIISEQ